MERLVAARSAGPAGGRSPARRGGQDALRAGPSLHEHGRGGRAAGSSVRVGPLPAALRVKDGRPAPRPALATAAVSAAPVLDRWAERPAFFFDLGCPFSYLAAERVERLLGDVEWVPVPSWTKADPESILSRAAVVARAARLPLVPPDKFPDPVPGAMRAAAYAAEIGAGARFALAALRLAFCGGFDLEKRGVLTDVASAARVPAADCLAATREEWRDEELQTTASVLSSQGVAELPVIGIDGRWFDGLGGLSEAAAWIRRG